MEMGNGNEMDGCKLQNANANASQARSKSKQTKCQRARADLSRSFFFMDGVECGSGGANQKSHLTLVKCQRSRSQSLSLSVSCQFHNVVSESSCDANTVTMFAITNRITTPLHSPLHYTAMLCCIACNADYKFKLVNSIFNPEQTTT